MLVDKSMAIPYSWHSHLLQQALQWNSFAVAGSIICDFNATEITANVTLYVTICFEVTRLQLSLNVLQIFVTPIFHIVFHNVFVRSWQKWHYPHKFGSLDSQCKGTRHCISSITNGMWTCDPSSIHICAGLFCHISSYHVSVNASEVTYMHVIYFWTWTAGTSFTNRNPINQLWVSGHGWIITSHGCLPIL